MLQVPRENILNREILDGSQRHFDNELRDFKMVKDQMTQLNDFYDLLDLISSKPMSRCGDPSTVLSGPVKSSSR